MPRPIGRAGLASGSPESWHGPPGRRRRSATRRRQGRRDRRGALLAGLPLLAQQCSGRASRSRAGRSPPRLRLRSHPDPLAGPAIVEAFPNLTPRSLVLGLLRRPGLEQHPRLSGCVAGRAEVRPRRRDRAPADDHRIRGLILFLTSRRSQVTPSALAIGMTTGLLFGVVMRGGNPRARPRCHESVLPGRRPIRWWRWPGSLVGGPGRAAVLAAWRGRGPGGAKLPRNVRIGQGIAAGVLANGIPRSSSPRSAPARSR